MRGEEEEGEGGKGEKGGVNLVTLCPYTGSCHSLAASWASKSKSLTWERRGARETGERVKECREDRMGVEGPGCEESWSPRPTFPSLALTHTTTTFSWGQYQGSRFETGIGRIVQCQSSFSF